MFYLSAQRLLTISNRVFSDIEATQVSKTWEHILLSVGDI